MASLGDGTRTRLSLDLNGHGDPFIASSTTSTNMRTQLQSLLDEKEKQLQLAGTLGQRILAQQMELEERINALSEFEHRPGSRTPDPEGDTEMRRKLEELAETMQSWETENEQLWGGFSQKLTNGPPSARPPQTPLTPSASPVRHDQRELPPEPEPDYSYEAPSHSGPSAAQSSRRAKNAVHRENDVKFAYDIGTSLLTEVRRLQSLISERDKMIQDMKAEKDDLDKENDSLRTSLRQQEASADKFKEVNWNLEVQIEEARTQLQDAQQNFARAESEVKRTTRQLAAARETAENQKSENERLTAAFEEFKVKHETDVAQMRKQAAALNRDKSDLQAALDTLKSDMAKRERTIKQRFGSPMSNVTGPVEVSTPHNIPNEEDIFSGATSRKKLDPSAYLSPGGISESFQYDSSPDPSPSKSGIVIAPNHPSNELEALKQALAHSQRQVMTLKGTIQREKEQKLHYKKLLTKEGLSTNIPGAWEDEDNDDQEEEKERSPAVRGRGHARPTRGRGPKILTLAQKLGLASVERHTGNEWEEEQESPTRPNNRNSLLSEEVEGDERSPTRDEPSPFLAQSRPTSVDGMDPAFANVLKQVDPSPLKPSPLASRVNGSSAPKTSPTAYRKPRGGAGFVEARPESLLGPPPGSLGAEMSGMVDTSLDTSLQTHSDVFEEFDEEDAPVVVATAPPREVSEMSTQTDLEVEPVLAPPMPVSLPPPKAETTECSIQTDELVSIVYAEQASATDPVPSPPPAPVPSAPLESELPYAQSKQLAEMEIQTDEMPSVEEVEIQTGPLSPVLDVEIRSLVIQREEVERPGAAVVPFPLQIPETSELPADDDESVPARTPRILSMASVRTARPVAMIFEDEEDRHVETETDGEYADARESVAATTPGPAESVSSFHSANTGSLHEEHEQSDAESVRTSRLAVRESYSSLTGLGRKVSQTKRISAASTPQQTRPPTPPPPKPEMKETAIQTDEWVPPTPVIPPSPAKSFHRVGTTGPAAPPFQYIPSPQRTADTSFASTAGSATPTQTGGSGFAKTPQRESVGTFGGLGRAQSPRGDRRPSIESALSAGAEDPSLLSPPRTQTLSVPPPVDRTKPPTMMLPPPPSMPPPPTIPVKKVNGVPPRPTSPPPPELIQRATTPTFQRSNIPSSLHVPAGGRSHIRQHGSSLPSTAQGLRGPPSTTSFRSAASPPTYATTRSPIASIFDPIIVRRGDRSTASLLSGGSSAIVSRRPSVSSSHSSEHHHATHPRTPGRPSISTSAAPNTILNGQSEDSDYDVIHAITQTMIGEFLYKYTRRVVGRGHGEKRHRRFFWVHPYTKTLYWSSADPGSSNASESSAKSAYMDSVKVILDPNPLPPGVYQYSIVVSTPQREMKFTAPTKERHEMWYRALKYLLERPSTIPVNSPTSPHLRPTISPPRQRKFSSDDAGYSNFMTSPRSVRSIHSGHSYSITPRAMRSQTQLSHQGSIGKRPGTPAAEYLRWAEEAQSPTRSVRSYPHASRTDDEEPDNVDAAAGEESFELNDEGFEAMENVRACCDGEHDLGALVRRPGQAPHHHHHHHSHINNRAASLSRPQTPAERPTSPSGWSFRSRAGSTNSEGGSRLSQWAGEAKRSIRFTNRGKSPAPSRPPLPMPRSNN